LYALSRLTAFVAGMLGRQVAFDVRDYDSKMDKVQTVLVDTPNRAGGKVQNIFGAVS
jgi:hypothetical protein